MLVAIPLVALAVGSAYSYSFAGLLWLVGAAGLWALVELAARHAARRPAAPGRLPGGRRAHRGRGRRASAVAVAPEVGRMVEFAASRPSTRRAGLGNLFNPISPLEALGIWPSGDFRLEPGAGAMPAAGFYLGGALAPGGACLRPRLVAAAWRARGPGGARRGGGTVRLRPFLRHAVPGGEGDRDRLAAGDADRRPGVAERRAPDGDRRASAVIARRRGGAPASWLALAMPWDLFGGRVRGAAAGCSLLALVNGPVRPRHVLARAHEAAPGARRGSTLVLAPQPLLADEHGRDYLVWELRGGRVCVEAAGASPSSPPAPAGIAHVITQGSAAAATVRRSASCSTCRARTRCGGSSRPREAHGSCPLISVGERAEPGS